MIDIEKNKIIEELKKSIPELPATLTFAEFKKSIPPSASKTFDFFSIPCGSGIKGLFNKAIRKAVKFLFMPVLHNQSLLNEEISEIIQEQALRIDYLETKIIDLESKIKDSAK